MQFFAEIPHPFQFANNQRPYLVQKNNKETEHPNYQYKILYMEQ